MAHKQTPPRPLSLSESSNTSPSPPRPNLNGRLKLEDLPDVMRVRHIAQFLDIRDEETVRSWLKKGLLPAWKIEGDWRIRKSAFEFFLAKRTHKAVK